MDEGARRDPRLDAARYAADRRLRDAVESGEVTEAEARQESARQAAQASATPEQRRQYVEVSLAQARRRGDFDDLPGAGRPLQNLGGTYDPDWWIRQKIERENITGLGPAAFVLRTEDRALDERIAAARTEGEIREMLDDFNRRVIDARRQLQGGPPVVTRTRDIDAEVERWAAARETARRKRERERARREAEIAALPWWRRGRARRRGHA